MSQSVKVLLTTGVLITAFTGLMWTSMKDAAAYYKHVDEVMVEPEVWAGKRLQVHGYASNISWKPSTMDYRFEIENNGYTVLAEYTGVVPDTFKEASEVVVSGRLEGHKLVVESNGIMAKCPSKYEAKPTLGAVVDGAPAPLEPLGVSN
jgi:cytochrome c-type biogenesis protein CcmE